MSRYYYVALVNPKSGGQVGSNLLGRFREILDDDRVHDLIEEGGPEEALKRHRGKDNLRIIACGGDGTVGWVLSAMDRLEYPRPRPAIGIIPLGTGNDLSRSLNWGGKYRDKPIRKVLSDIARADVIDLDRWTLKVTPASAAASAADANGAGRLSDDSSPHHPKVPPPVDRLPLNVLNNYFSVGIDAQISLNFHRARNNNPDQFTSRTRNLLFYGLEGGKDLFKQSWRDLMSHVTVVCDGVDLTDRLAAYGAHSVIFLNIRSYAGGTKPWNRKNGSQEVDDGLLEVVAIDNLDLAILQAGGSGASVCQCKTATITTTTPVPMQIDGEPVFMAPATIVIEHRNRSKMLVRNKNAGHTYEDHEIENWAANKIQSSFKQYKKQKTMTTTTTATKQSSSSSSSSPKSPSSKR